MKSSSATPCSLRKHESSHRWKWMAGSSAAAGAMAAPAVTAGTVQINQTANFVTQGTVSLKQDLTMDGTPDLPSLGGSFQNGVPNYSFNSGFTSRNYAKLFSASQRVFGTASNFYEIVKSFSGSVQSISNKSAIIFATGSTGVASHKSTWTTTNQIQPAQSTLFPITFEDDRINGGATTNAFLEVRFSRTIFNDQTITLVRLVFSDENTAAPAMVMAGGSDPVWVSPEELAAAAATEAQAAAKAAQISTLSRKIKKLKAKSKKVKKSGNTIKAKKLKANLKKLKKQLKSL